MGAVAEQKSCGNALTVCAAAVLAGGLLFLPFGQSSKAAEIFERSFWNTLEVGSQNLRPFRKWRAALQRYSKETARDRAGTCSSSLLRECPYERWRGFLDDVRDKDKWTQMVAVNAFMNARRYVSDERNWGVNDYWATPGEFLARSGDCEDYAIAKYLSLKELGWDEGELRVVVVRDSNLNVAHAVLVAFYGGRAWVLDNQTSRVTETVDVAHYRPVFSISERSWWHHRPNLPPRPTTFATVLTGATPAGVDPPR